MSLSNIDRNRLHYPPALVATYWTLLEWHWNPTSSLPDGYKNTSYLSDTSCHACCWADGVLTYVQQVFHCGYICAYVSIRKPSFLLFASHYLSRDPNKSVLQSDDAHKGQSVWCPFKCLSSCRCPSVKEMTSDLLLCGLSFRRPTELVSFLWIDECRVPVCSGALLHKKIIMRRWGLLLLLPPRAAAALCKKLVFMTDTRWLSYLINIPHLLMCDTKELYFHFLHTKWDFEVWGW